MLDLFQCRFQTVEFVKWEKFIVIETQLLFFLRTVTGKIVRNLLRDLRNICYDLFQVPAVGIADCGNIKRLCSVYAAEAGTESAIYSGLAI